MTQLPQPDYNYSDLEPHIDAKTMKFIIANITKHTLQFVDAIMGTDLEQRPTHDISNLNDVFDTIRGAIRNNGGGHLNYSLFWKVIGPNGGACWWVTTGINAVLPDAFKQAFESEAVKRSGSGCGHKADAQAHVWSVRNQDSLLWKD